MTAVSPVDPAYDDGMLRITWLPQGNGFLVEGTVDVSNRSGLAAALAAAAQRSGDVQVDLSGLEFIDMDGARLLVRAARGLASGRLLVLRRMPSHLRELLRAVNTDDAPGLRWEQTEG